MPRDRAATPPPPSDVYVWLGNFVEELQRIRPHVSLKLANVIGRQEYMPTRDPKEAAAAYHARQEPDLPATPAVDAKEHPRDKARQYDKAQRGTAPNQGQAFEVGDSKGEQSPHPETKPCARSTSGSSRC